MRDLLDSVARMGSRHPNKTAVIEGETSLDFDDLDASVDRAAWIMSANGMRPGGVLGYFGGTGLDRIVALLAAQKLGAAFVPFDPADPASIHEVILRNAGLTGVAATPEFLPQARRIADAPVTIPTGKVARRDVDRFEPADVDEKALSLIKYTSGTTGLPKGVPSTREAEAHYARIAVRAANLTAEDRVSFFGTYRTWAIYGALMTGATIGCFDVKSYGFAALVEWLDDQRISTLFCFPALFRQIVAAERPLPALRHIQLVGEPVTRSDVEAFERICPPGSVLMNKYGSSEYPWIAAYSHSPGDPIQGEILPMGHAVEAGEVELEDADGEPVPVGEVGEVVVVSPFAPEGYHDDPERSAPVFRIGRDGKRRYHTGDLAVADSDGCLHSMGRKDDQIKIRGNTLRPSVIEQELTGHPEVAEAAVVAVAYPGGVQRLVCHYVGGADTPTLRSFLSERLPGYMVPGLFLKHDALPKTRTGKISRQELPSPFRMRGAGRTD